MAAAGIEGANLPNVIFSQFGPAMPTASWSRFGLRILAITKTTGATFGTLLHPVPRAQAMRECVGDILALRNPFQVLGPVVLLLTVFVIDNMVGRAWSDERGGYKPVDPVISRDSIARQVYLQIVPALAVRPGLQDFARITNAALYGARCVTSDTPAIRDTVDAFKTDHWEPRLDHA